MPDLPKLSYVLLSHNRERYIRTAIESAFAQDYEGELEYIFSDDCSTDQTYEIMKECVAAYKGPRRVVLTQTPRNLHLAGNTNHAAQFVESDWMVRADDDDISAVDRCTLIGRAIAAHPEASMVFGTVENFTDKEEADVLKRAATLCSVSSFTTKSDKPSMKYFSGLSDGGKSWSHQVWSMKHFRTFGELPTDGYYIDDLTAFYRCAVLGNAVFFDHPISYIRVGSNNMCRGGDDGKDNYKALVRLELFHDKYNDITRRPLREELDKMQHYVRQHPEMTRRGQDVLNMIKSAIEGRELWHGYWTGSTLHRLRVRKQAGGKGLFSLLRCLPLPLFAGLMTIYRTLIKR